MNRETRSFILNLVALLMLGVLALTLSLRYGPAHWTAIGAFLGAFAGVVVFVIRAFVSSGDKRASP